MKLKFCGAARCVTGSCHMLCYDGGKVLIDCGMRQGADEKGELGASDFAFDPKEIDAVLLTHAHIDHSGLLPLLAENGVFICSGIIKEREDDVQHALAAAGYTVRNRLAKGEWVCLAAKLA